MDFHWTETVTANVVVTVKGVDTMNTTLGKSVSELEERYQEVETLCGEMITTITMKSNRWVFDELPSTWHDMVKSWKRRWDEFKEKEKSK